MKTASCFGPAHILLPGENIPLEKWGCVACDQFTSDRAYWEQADAVVGGCPSTLRLILPESCLDGPSVETDIMEINKPMTTRNMLASTLTDYKKPVKLPKITVELDPMLKKRFKAEAVRRGAAGMDATTPLVFQAAITLLTCALIPFAAAAAIRINLR